MSINRWQLALNIVLIIHQTAPKNANESFHVFAFQLIFRQIFVIIELQDLGGESK